jgi:pimeloyl-ACP methyl ester carboxylesterase
MVIDGYRMTYTDLGPVRGPVVLCIHGLVSDSTTWQRPGERLAARGYRVIAPDLLGHGPSDRPRDGYSIAGFASQAGQLLDHLGIPSATVAGHSYGAAVVMAMAYELPEKVDRLVLVAAGGLGREIHPIFRAATLPGASTVLGLLVNEQTAKVYRRRQLHQALRLSPNAVSNLGRAGRGLASREGRRAFFMTLNTAIIPSGQRGSMVELNYVDPLIPTLLVWSRGDPVVPLAHAEQTHAKMPNSRLLVFPGTTHQPHHHNAEPFAAAVAALIEDFPPGHRPAPDPPGNP